MLTIGSISYAISVSAPHRIHWMKYNLVLKGGNSGQKFTNRIGSSKQPSKVNG